ncbi:hypothetical protein Pcinc_017364 [Petrolisthes cinctipes]|uniref:Uncharacterized protein n=1 Tax=Petrolisthes cinctipes TaxID=88211 RepID=A0AAE1FPB0_PETCI|nr:hypothetical protein Pcinc_017364 [Petrolisthes cinctipes]
MLKPCHRPPGTTATVQHVTAMETEAACITDVLCKIQDFKWLENWEATLQSKLSHLPWYQAVQLTTLLSKFKRVHRYRMAAMLFVQNFDISLSKSL